MSLIITRANPSNWVAGNLLTAVQVNTLDTNTIAVADYLESLAKDVTLFGAAGDGSTDDSSAIADAFTAAVSAGNVPVYFPPGEYNCNNVTWPAKVSILGVPGSTILSCNHASNPILVSSASDTDSQFGGITKTCSGIHFKFDTESGGGELVHVSGNTRVRFENCSFNGSNCDLTSLAASRGLLGIGASSNTTIVEAVGCGFVIAEASHVYGQAVGDGGGNTRFIADRCVFTLSDASRSFAYALVESDIVQIVNSRFEMSGASAASTYVPLIESNDNATLVGSSVTNLASGTTVLFQGTPHVVEHGNLLGTLVLPLYPTDEPDRVSIGRNRQSSDSSNAASVAVDLLNNSVFRVLSTNDTAKTVSALVATGLFACLHFRKGAGTSEVISFGTGFGDISWDGALANGDFVSLQLACFDKGTGGGVLWHQVATETTGS